MGCVPVQHALNKTSPMISAPSAEGLHFSAFHWSWLSECQWNVEVISTLFNMYVL